MGSNYFNILRSGLGGGGGTFTPQSLFAAGEHGFWFDPSDFSTMFQDTAGTIPVTAVGQSIGKILDKSGNGNHAISATPLPTLGQDANLNYYINLNGTNNSLSIASLNMSAADEVSIFAGTYRARQTATDMILEFSINAAVNPDAFRCFYVLNSPSFTFANLNSVDGATASTPAVPSLVAFYCSSKRSTPIISAQINNNTIVTNTVAQGTGNYGTYPFYIGSRAGTSLFFQGRIYQAIVRGKLSSALEISNARAYVNSKTAAY